MNNKPRTVVFIYTPARWGKRIVAFIVDIIILKLIRFPLIFIFSPDQQMLFIFVNLWILITYFAAFESSPWKATPGKLMMGIRVSRIDGEAPLFYQTLQRICLGLISLGTSFMCALWNRHTLAFHDEFTDTCVIEEWWE